jgi:hypothetical protein
VTVYNGTLGWNGAAQNFAVDFDAATTQVQLQNLSAAPLAFVWGPRIVACNNELTVLAFQTVFFTVQDAARGGSALPTGVSVFISGSYAQSFAIEVD